ncbi:MAG: DNA polymerase III subunit delta, partial [Pseudomonadota bacterium]
MKLTGAQAAGYADAPDPGKAGVLVYGADAMRVALKRQALIKALIGPDGEGEMRLTRIQGTDARKDKAMITDALKAVGFFPGPRAVLVEQVTDQAADSVLGGLADWAPGDA